MHSNFLSNPTAIAMAQSTEISTQTNDEHNGFEIKISKSKFQKIESEVNCAYWKNLHDLITKLISFDCEFFGGAARDFVCRQYWAENYYEFMCKRHINNDTHETYDNPSVHPESYEGRRLLPTDLDIFIKGKANFEKVIEYLKRNFKIKEFELSEDALPHLPYFLETNAELKKVLEYHRFEIQSMQIPLEVRRMFSCIREFLPEELASKIWTGITIQLDIIVLKDNWRELETNFDESEVCPPFGNADFRCNQLSLVKCKDSHRYELKANMQFIQPIAQIENETLFNRKQLETNRLQREADNLQLIIDDIIAKRALLVSDQKVVAPHRILKMEKKGYTIDLFPLFPSITKIPLQSEDKCSICMESLNEATNVMKPCECSTLLHAECWAQLMRSHNDSGNLEYTCASCRRDLGLICTRSIHYLGEKISDCAKINMLCAVSHYRDPENIANRVPYVYIDCNCCRERAMGYTYAN